VASDAPSCAGSGKRLELPEARRVISIVLGSLVAVALIIATIGAILPRTWSVERSILINAPASSVHEITSDLEYWDDWAEWDRQDRPVSELGPLRSGTGASLHFSAGGVAAGRVRIVRSDVERGVSFEIELDGGRTSQAAISYTPRLAATEVTWRDTGTLPPIIGPLMRDLVETRLAGHIDVGLARLKDLVEGASAGSATPRPAPR
jgi:hypothetical protein